MENSAVKNKTPIIVRLLAVFAVLLIVSISVAGYFLKRGITLDRLMFGDIVISDCSLVWKTKLEFHISEITVSKAEKSRVETSENTRSDVSFVRRGFKAGYYLSVFFSKLNIEKVTIGKKSFAIDLNQKNTKTYELFVTSDDFVSRSLLTFSKETLDIDILEVKSSNFNSELKGKVHFHGPNSRATGEISALINGNFPVSLDFIADNQQISFQGSEAGEITEIKSLVDLFGLSHGIQRWITDYLSGSRYHLKSFKGALPWKNPKKILDTLEVEVRVDDTEYTFAPGLQPIKDTSTDVFFRKGVLIIKPQTATFYGQDAGDSWLDINFNDTKNILLTAYIKTHAVANDDILNLLNYYKIPLPFKQTEGSTATDLQLVVNFRTKKVEAAGTFKIDKGAIQYGTKNYSVKDAQFKLVNTDVTINQLEIGYENILKAQIKGRIQAKTKSGDLDITLEKLSLKIGESLLVLDGSEPGPKMHYHFDPQGNMLDVPSSSWNFDSLKLHLGDFRVPVNLKELSIEFPKVRLEAPLGILSEVSGYLSIKKQQANITCDILKYRIKDLELTSGHLALTVKYDQGLTITTEKTAWWTLGNVPVSLFPSEFSYSDEILTVIKSSISYGDFFESHVAGYFNKRLSKGEFTLLKIDVTNQNIKKSFYIDNDAHVVVSGAKGKYEIVFPEFNLVIRTDKEKNWSAALSDLSVIHPRSKILQRYNIKEGNVVLSSVNGKKPYTFSGNLRLPYPLLVEGDTLIDLVNITGRLTDEGIFATINKNLTIEYTDNSLTINSSETGYNVTAIIKLLQEFAQSSPPKSKGTAERKPFSMSVNAKKSQLYLSPKSRVIAEVINLESQGGILSMQLDHGSGHIQLETEDGSFTLDGNNLNDQFMGALIHDSTFKGGQMSFTLSGLFDDFSAIVKIEDTVWHQMVLLNNVMAFINTVPSLITFSLPEYNTNGLLVDSAVMGMKFKNKVATIESMELKSSEVWVKGVGSLDFSKKEIDVDISLKTQSGKNVGTIPLAGYVLAGDDDDESLSLNISGGFDNPEVSNTLARDIVVYPIDFLHRTLKLPFHLFKKPKTDSGEE